MPHYSITEQEFHQLFPDNNACLDYLFQNNYPHPKCEKCGKVGKFYKHPKRACYSCSCGGTHIFPKKGTIFERSRTDLVKWFHAVFEMSKSKNGMAAHELQRKIGVTLEAAWRMLHQIRRAMDTDELGLLSGEVEADETFIGGKRRGEGRGRGTKGKQIVFGAVERKGKVKASVVNDMSKQEILPHIADNIAKGTRLITDEFRTYKQIARLLDMEHATVNHGAREYAKPDGTNTNTIEGFWSQLKRSVDGTHHVISPKYLSLYVAEYQWRYNHRLAADSFLLLLRASTCKPARVEREIGAYRRAVCS